MFPFQSILSKATKMSMFDYCNLESNVIDTEGSENDTFVCKDSSYSTMYRLNGSLVAVADNGILEIAKDLESKLQGNLDKKGYRLQFVFENNPELSSLPIEKSLNPVLESMAKVGMKVSPLIESRQRALASCTTYERAFLVVTTFPLVKKSSQSTMMQNRGKKGQKAETGVKPAEYGQSHFFELPELLENHSAICSTIEKELKAFMSVDKLSCHEAMYEIKQSIDDNSVSEKWRPTILGDKMTPRLVKDGCNDQDQSHILNMDIGFQLFNKIPVQHDSMRTSVQYGNNIITPLNMDLPPQDLRPFSELFDDIDPSIPWRISFVIETGHKEILSKIKNKKSLASIVAITSSNSKEVVQAAEQLIGVGAKHKLVSCKIACCTWGKTEKEASLRKEILTQALQGWGSCDIIEEMGDPIELWTNTIPAISQKYIATAFPMPLGEAFYISPISRPASPWKTGSGLYRTKNRKLFPIEQASGQQTSWLDIYVAPPGFGKSFKLAADNMSFLMGNARNGVLPRLAMLDIGYSLGSFVEFAQSLAPDHMKSLFAKMKLRMSKTDTSCDINPFDTPLGCRTPLTLDKEFLLNFLLTAFTPVGSDKTPLRLPELLSLLIDEMYLHFSDERSPNIYQYGVAKDVDNYLEENDIEVDEETTWWRVFDIMFERKQFELASKAQRLAMPTINDISTVITGSTSIIENFGSAMFEGTEEKLVDFVKQMAMSIVNEYPILARPSELDLSYARVVALDLSEVAPKGSTAKAKQRRNLMYMVGRYVLGRDFYQNEQDTVPQVPDKYAEYHRVRLQKEGQIPKKLVFDEFHRVQDCRSIQDQLDGDAREGRKFWVTIALASQAVTDFSPSIRGLADNIYILSKGKSPDELKDIVKCFQPSEDAKEDLVRYATGPTSKGSAFLYLGTIKGSNVRVEQLLYLTLGPIELWGYTTTLKDYKLRQEMIKLAGVEEGLQFLAKKFPKGSADNYMKYLEKTTDIPEGTAIYEVAAKKLAEELYH